MQQMYKNTTPKTYEATSAENSPHPWLKHFPVTSRTRVGLWFNLPAKGVHGRLAPVQLVERVRQDMLQHIHAGYEPQHTDACRVLQALEDDPHGALDYVNSVFKYQQLPVEEQKRVRAARGEEFKRTAMARKPPSAPQLALLCSLHYTGPRPANSLEASTLIDALRRR
jgi:hypothetical protein